MADIEGQSKRLKVFMTGATGYIGRAVVRELVGAGHHVTGLTHRDHGLHELSTLGAEGVLGDIREPDGWRAEAVDADALVHLARQASGDTAAADRSAIKTLLWAAQRSERSDHPLPRSVVYTSGCFVLGNTGASPATEDAPLDPPDIVAFRPEHEKLVLDANSEHVAASVVRPGMVFGGGEGLINEFFATAIDEGAARFVGDGLNRWSPVHREDVASLYRLVVELRAGGVYHAVDGTAIAVADLATAAATAAGRFDPETGLGRTLQVPLEDARRELGAFADALVLDQVVAAPRAHDLGWQPSRPPFMDDAQKLFYEWRESQR